ncbi:MAG TPA: ROK family protein, partial [Methylophilaceae bacterium]|nr:ROK family protein [Methylophilaceae bacterium]
AWQMILSASANGIKNMLDIHPEVEHIGIGFPGFIDPVTNTIVQSPNLPGLFNVNLAHDLASLIQKKVVVENDANAAAFGEYYLAKQPASGLIFMGLGTGVGGGLILNGKPYVGHHGCAMEVGHIIIEPKGRLCGCGNLGCMEQYASASGVSLSYYLSTKKKSSAEEIAQLAYIGRESAIKAFNVAGASLAQALASILKVTDVQHVIIGGGLTAAWDLMSASFNQRLNQDLIPVLRQKVKVEITTAQDVAGMLGAAMLANID